MKSQSTNRIFSLIVALLLIVTSFSIGVFAQDGEEEAAELGQIDEGMYLDVMPNLQSLEQPIVPPELDIDALPDVSIVDKADPSPRVNISDEELQQALERDRAGDYENRANYRAGAANVGDRVTMKDANGASKSFTYAAVSTYGEVYVEVGNANHSYYVAEAQAIANEFDDIYSLLTNRGSKAYIADFWFFGQNVKTKILLQYTGGSPSGYTAGMFSPFDFLGRSNDDPILHMDIGTQTGHAVYTDPTQQQGWFGTMAHEFQHLLAFGNFYRAALAENSTFYKKTGDPDYYSQPTTWADEGRSGVVDIVYADEMNFSHYISFLLQDFASGTGYVPYDLQWEATGNKVYANYGAAGMLLYDYYQYHVASSNASANSLNATLGGNRIGYYYSMDFIGDNINIGTGESSGGSSFDDFFLLANLDMAVSNLASEYGAIRAAGYNAYYHNVNDSGTLWGDRYNYSGYAGSGDYLGVKGISPGSHSVSSGGRAYYSNLYLADPVGVGKDTAVITVPNSNSAKYYVITPFNQTHVDNDIDWITTGKIAAALAPGENQVIVGTNNMFAVLVVNFSSAVSGESFSYTATRTGGVLDFTSITSNPTTLVSGEGGTINVTVEDAEQGVTSFTARMVESDNPDRQATGFTFDQNTYTPTLNTTTNTNRANLTITADNTVKAGSYSIELTVTLADNSTEKVLSPGIVFTVDATLATPADGATADPASVTDIKITFDGPVTPVQGGRISIGSSGVDYVAELAESDTASNSISVPISSFKRGSENIILNYNDEYEVTVEAGAVEDTYGATNTQRTAGTFYTSAEGADPSIIPAKLIIAKGDTGVLGVYFGTGGYNGGTVTEYDDSIISVDTEEITASGDRVSVEGIKVGSTKLTIGFSDSDGNTIEKSVDVSVTGEPDQPSGGRRPSSGGSGGSSGGTSVSDQQRAASGTGVSVNSPVTKEQGVKAAQDAIAAAKAAGESTAVARLTNKSEISLEVMKAMAAEAEKAGLTLMVHADVVEGNVVVLRITFNPANATKDIKLGGAVSPTAASIVPVATRFAKYFDNELAIVALNQAGDYGMQVHIAAKVDLSKLSTQTLSQYCYDGTTNNYARIASPGTFVDSKNYLHFDTTQAGAILTADKALTLK